MLSIIIPAYNEENTVFKILERVVHAKTQLLKEIIVVNDGSTDRTKKEVERFIELNKNIRLLLINKVNGGKGSAIIEGIKHAAGDIILIQDADLEYNPEDYPSLIEPILKNETKIVYGSRIINRSGVKKSYILAYYAGRVITLFTNLLYAVGLTDESTGYKVFSKDVFKDIKLECTGFDFCPEITAKVAKKGHKIKEVPISYSPRLYGEGKKIKWKDGIIAIWTLIKYRF